MVRGGLFLKPICFLKPVCLWLHSERARWPIFRWLQQNQNLGRGDMLKSKISQHLPCMGPTIHFCSMLCKFLQWVIVYRPVRRLWVGLEKKLVQIQVWEISSLQSECINIQECKCKLLFHMIALLHLLHLFICSFVCFLVCPNQIYESSPQQRHKQTGSCK